MTLDPSPLILDADAALLSWIWDALRQGPRYPEPSGPGFPLLAGLDDGRGAGIAVIDDLFISHDDRFRNPHLPRIGLSRPPAEALACTLSPDLDPLYTTDPIWISDLALAFIRMQRMGFCCDPSACVTYLSPALREPYTAEFPLHDEILHYERTLAAWPAFTLRASCAPISSTTHLQVETGARPRVMAEMTADGSVASLTFRPSGNDIPKRTDTESAEAIYTRIMSMEIDAWRALTETDAMAQSLIDEPGPQIDIGQDITDAIFARHTPEAIIEALWNSDGTLRPELNADILNDGDDETRDFFYVAYAPDRGEILRPDYAHCLDTLAYHSLMLVTDSLYGRLRSRVETLQVSSHARMKLYAERAQTTPAEYQRARLHVAKGYDQLGTTQGFGFWDIPEYPHGHTLSA